MLTSQRLKEKVHETKQLLKQRKQDIMHAESLLGTRHAVDTYSLEDLGKGHSRGRGGASAAQKRRLEVLGRMVGLGQGLSPEQKNDFGSWKNAWDEQMLEHHGDHWAEVFAGWVTRI